MGGPSLIDAWSAFCGDCCAGLAPMSTVETIRGISKTEIETSGHFTRTGSSNLHGAAFGRGAKTGDLLNVNAIENRRRRLRLAADV